MIKTIEKSASRLLQSVNVFDVFESDKLGDQKSIALTLTFGSDHTMEEKEIQEVMNKVNEDLIKQHKLTIR